MLSGSVNFSVTLRAFFSRIEKIIERQVFPEVRRKDVRNIPPLVRGPALEFINRNRVGSVTSSLPLVLELDRCEGSAEGQEGMSLCRFELQDSAARLVAGQAAILFDFVLTAQV